MFLMVVVLENAATTGVRLALAVTADAIAVPINVPLR
jgi:hypothetical protein